MKEAVPANFPIIAMVVDTTGRSVSNIFEKHLQIYGKYTLKNSNLSLKKKKMYDHVQGFEITIWNSRDQEASSTSKEQVA